MSKRVLVFGGSGMLGKRVVAALHQHGHMVSYPAHSIADTDQITEVDRIMRDTNPAVIINCAGVIAARGLTPTFDMVAANAMGPHVIAYEADQRGGIPVIHISTDCVFSGVPNLRMPGRRYSADDPADATDVYGRSKALGEVQAPHVTNVRTSFIGPEHGLWAWLVSQDNSFVEGWANAFWTGSTADAVAAAIAELAENPPGGTVHLATEEKVSKLDVLRMLKERLNLDIVITAFQEPHIDRALEPTIVLPSLQEALLGLGKERVRS